MENKSTKLAVVYDIETLFSCFTYTAMDVNNKTIYQYVIHKDRNDLNELIKHLKNCAVGIGFNNINFDYPIIHYLLTSNLNNLTAEEICKLIHQKAQDIINQQNQEEFNTIVAIPQKKWLIFQVDLFKMWHYNNKNRKTSLKALEISMNFPNVMESPIDHNKEDITIEEVEDILEYNLNDVLATYEFYKKSADKIALRKKLMNKYNIPCISWNNGKIGEQLILKLYCQKTGLDIWDVKERRTYRPRIELSKCVPDITFESKEFNDLLNYFKSLTISSTKGEANKQLIFKGIKYDYGSGGVHACIKPGIYESNDKFIIKSCDVASLYPNLAIQYDFYIEHLGKEFLDVYKGDIVDVRMAEKAKGKNGDKAIVDGFKEAANVPYGKSNEVFSFLYDPLYTMKTTIHGQLLMSKLCEMLSNIEDSQILMVNTDGLEIMIPVYKQDEYTSICKKWEELTRLTLEFSDYKKLWVRDINNYGCIDFKGKIKNKGAFEVDKAIVS